APCRCRLLAVSVKLTLFTMQLLVTERSCSVRQVRSAAEDNGQAVGGWNERTSAAVAALACGPLPSGAVLDGRYRDQAQGRRNALYRTEEAAAALPRADIRRAAPLGGESAGQNAVCSARSGWQLAALHLQPDGGSGPQARAISAGLWPFALGAPRNPVGQRPRTRNACPRRDLCRNPLCRGLAGPFTSLEGFHAAARNLRYDPPRARLCGRGGAVRACHRRGGAGCKAAFRARSSKAGGRLRHRASDKTARRGGRGAPIGDWRYHRQIPLYLGLHRNAQGGDQHQPNDLRQPDDGARGLYL